MARSFPSVAITLLVWLCLALRAYGDQLKSFSELDCGVLWFLHFPKTAGGSITAHFDAADAKSKVMVAITCIQIEFIHAYMRKLLHANHT
jgi:hypothetical protein